MDIDANNYYVNDVNELNFLLDSFKIVNVIDNRKVKDSIIGNVNDEGEQIPLFIDGSLPEYLKMIFNYFLTDDNLKNNYIPVTVYVDELFSERSNRIVNQQYSFLFEYTIDSDKKSTRVQRSSELTNVYIKKQKYFIISGIKEAARQFSWYIKNKQYLDFGNESESTILNGSNYTIREEDKKFRLDSFKVVNVIDNRKVKDSVIGYLDYSNSSIILNRALPDYLKMMFNVLISSDSTQKSFTPVTVYVDDFHSQKLGLTKWDETIYSKFSYWFEYPYKSEIKKTKVVDSIVIKANTIREQKSLIIDGIREAAGLFTWNIKQMLNLDSTKIATSDTTIITKNIDTLDIRHYRDVYSKVGAFFNYNFGLKTDVSFSLSYIHFFQFPKLFRESYSSFGFQYEMLDDQKNIMELYSFIFPSINRYVLLGSSDSNSLYRAYFDGVFTFVLGAEKSRFSSEKFFFGFRLEEKIGFVISKNVTIEAGLFQQVYLLSKYLPFNAGLIFSVCLTDNYTLRK
jgi:hypothetical protein